MTKPTHFGVEPISGIPMVRVVDENGNELFRGWYYRHISRQPCVINDELHDEDVHHVVMHDSFADWNMPKRPIATEVAPPHRIEVIND